MILTYLVSEQKKRQDAAKSKGVQPTKAEIEITTTIILVMLILEIALAVYAITLAVKCGRKNKNEVLHVLGAIFFPVPYIIFYHVSKSCK